MQNCRKLLTLNYEAVPSLNATKLSDSPFCEVIDTLILDVGLLVGFKARVDLSTP